MILKRPLHHFLRRDPFFSQALDLAQGNVGVLVDLYNTLGDYSVINLGVNELPYLASVILNKNISSIDMVTLLGELDSEGTYAEYNLDKKACMQ